MDLLRPKGVHIKLDKSTHAHFKARLIHHNVSMQDAFETFAKLVAEGNHSANAIVERFVRMKIKEELASVGLKFDRPIRKQRFVENIDTNGLYDLIDEADSNCDKTP
jgi:hypothetical protein